MNFTQTIKRAVLAAVAPLIVAVLSFTSVATAEAPASPALWKLSDEDSTVYLFGTVHILDPTISWHSKAVEDAFNESEILVLEADVPDQPTQEMMMLMMKYGQNPANVQLSSLLSEQSNAKLIELLVSFGIPAAQAEQMKTGMEQLRPWLVGLQLAALQAQSRGGDPKAGVESILKDAADVQNMSLQYLETLEQQLGFFASLSTEKEVQMLEEGITQMLEQPGMLDELVQEWRTGNAKEVGRQMQAAISDPMIYEVLLTNRNKDWAHQIDTIMDGAGAYFIAVGTGHLVGPQSVQEHLKALGFNPARVQ